MVPNFMLTGGRGDLPTLCALHALLTGCGMNFLTGSMLGISETWISIIEVWINNCWGYLIPKSVPEDILGNIETEYLWVIKSGLLETLPFSSMVFPLMFEVIGRVCGLNMARVDPSPHRPLVWGYS